MYTTFLEFSSYSFIPNSFCSKLLVDSTKETHFPFYRHHPCPSDIYTGGPPSGGLLQVSEVPVDSLAEILEDEEACFIFTSTGEGFQLSNLRTNALQPQKCQPRMEKMNTVANCIFLY